MMQRVVAASLVLAALGTDVAADRVTLDRDPVAVAVVIEGPMLYLTNSGTENDSPVFPALQLALDTIAEQAPAGSMGALLVYYSEVQALRELGPLSTMRGDVLGNPTDYEGRMGRNLVGGVTRALGELEQARSASKALIIVGDGADNQLDRAPAAMRELYDRAARHGIAIYALVYDVGLGDTESALRGLAAIQVRELRGHLDIVPAFEAVLRDVVGAPPNAPPAKPEPPSAGPAGVSRTLAWSLLAAGVVLGALGAVALVRRRAATAGRAS
jgi:hypothetical protein